MRVLYVYCHPLADSFHAAIRTEALAALADTGHDVDLLDLYAEGFDPVLTAERRRVYHDPARNRRNNATYADRLAAAEGLIVQFPTWSFGPPAMLKGWFDRMFGPGIALDLSDPAHAKPMLHNIRCVSGISTYGRPRWQAIAMADPPRKIVTRYLPWFTAKRTRVRYHALYHMNMATADQRARFLATVGQAMRAF
jgi:putative NADPH-quinone reductase